MYSSTATPAYVGYGDFVGFETYTAAQRRLQSEPLARQARLRMSGDVQSPPGSSAAAKQHAIAQAGIYACGQFKTKVTTEKNIVSVNLFKDMTARVALATMSPMDPGDRSLGILKYEFLDSSIGYNIRFEDDLSQFASVLVGALKYSNDICVLIFQIHKYVTCQSCDFHSLVFTMHQVLMHQQWVSSRRLLPDLARYCTVRERRDVVWRVQCGKQLHYSERGVPVLVLL